MQLDFYQIIYLYIFNLGIVFGIFMIILWLVVLTDRDYFSNTKYEMTKLCFITSILDALIWIGLTIWITLASANGTPIFEMQPLPPVEAHTGVQK